MTVEVFETTSELSAAKDLQGCPWFEPQDLFDTPPRRVLYDEPPIVPDEPDWTVWSSNPFDLIQKPFGAFLEPEGYAKIARMKSPQTTTYESLMPRTTRLARSIYAAVPEIGIWGKQIPEKPEDWITVTAGKNGPFRRQQAMSEFYVIKSLAFPNGRAIASQDYSGDQFSYVQHVRFDIDLDRTFQHDGVDRRHELVGEIAIVNDVFAAFGLSPQVFRTGNRGIQAIAPIKPLKRAYAWVLTECIKTVLTGHPGREWRASDFKSPLDCLMRLPLGLHAFTGSLGLFLDKNGSILPPEEQVEAAHQAFWLQDDSLSECDLPFAPQDNCDWAEEMRPRLGVLHAVPKIALRDIVTEFPCNSLVQTFLGARGRFDVKGWGDECVAHTNKVFQSSAVESEFKSENECVAYTNRVFQSTATEPRTNEFTETEFGSNEFTSTGNLRQGSCPARLKQIGQAILDEGFEPGNSFQYYVHRMNGVIGRNAIGWALVLKDGDKEAAKTLLDSQAEDVPGTPETFAQRKALIARGIKHNNTYERFMSWQNLDDHKSVDVVVTKSDTANADRILAALPDLRQNSGSRKKSFTAKTLTVIKCTLELMQAMSRTTEDGLIQASARTLASMMPTGVNNMDVSRALPWITAGHYECLIEAIEIVQKPTRATDPTVYRLGPGMSEL